MIRLITGILLGLTFMGASGQAQLSAGGSAGKGSPNGPSSGQSTSSSDVVRNTGVTSTVNRPVDNAPKSQAPDTASTAEQGLQDQNTATQKDTATESAKNAYLAKAQQDLARLDQRIQNVQDLVNVAPEGMKTRLEPMMTKIHDRRTQAQSLIDKINGDSGRQFKKDKLHLDTALNDLDSRLRDSERKFNK